MKEYEKSSRKAISLLYFLIVGFAITKSLQIAFTKNDLFQWTGCRVLLFIVFQTFIIRFFLGAYRIYSKDIEIEERSPKLIIDAIGFYLQALLFYIYSLNFYELIFSQYMIIILCGLDTIWLVILFFLKITEPTFKKWVLHNIVMLIFCIISIRYEWSSTILLIVSLVAFLQDFIFNRKFYLLTGVTSKKILS